MSPAPLPPHERAWRHPSELVLVEHEPTSTGGRMLIVTTATIGLILVGLLAVSMTPDRTAAPDATSATITLPPPRVRDEVAATAGADEKSATSDPVPATTARPASTVATASPIETLALTTTSVAATSASYPMLTPVGDAGLAITSARAAGGAGPLEAQLPSGELVHVEVLSIADGIVVVVLPAASQMPGLELSAAPPVGPTDTVAVRTAGADEPMIVTVRDLARLDIADGTPVTDADGNLIGICSRDPRAGAAGTSLTPVATLPAPPTTATADASTSAPPATSPPPATAAPSTTAGATTSSTDAGVSGTDAASGGSG